MNALADARATITVLDENGQVVVTPPEVAPAVKPEGVPDKFWDATTGTVRVAEMAKSYAELEKSKGKPTTGVPPVVADATASEAQDVVTAAGLDFDALTDEYTAGGELSAETYAKMEAGGIPRARVDQFIAGQQAIAAQTRADAFSVTGGEQGYTAMAAWAKANVPAGELALYNAQLTGPKDQVMLAVAGLHGRYVVANGANPSHIEQGRNPIGADGDAYGTMKEYAIAIRDRRYNNDPGYRAQVDAKASRSNI